jgi:hypothetical protein
VCIGSPETVHFCSNLCLGEELWVVTSWIDTVAAGCDVNKLV